MSDYKQQVAGRAYAAHAAMLASADLPHAIHTHKLGVI